MHPGGQGVVEVGEGRLVTADHAGQQLAVGVAHRGLPAIDGHQTVAFGAHVVGLHHVVGSRPVRADRCHRRRHQLWFGATHGADWSVAHVAAGSGL